LFVFQKDMRYSVWNQCQYILFGQSLKDFFLTSSRFKKYELSFNL